MKINNIIETINVINYENLNEVIVPVEHLVKLRAEILNLRNKLKKERINHNRTKSEALAIMAKTNTPKFEEYA